MMIQVDLNVIAANTTGFDLDLGVGDNLACVFSATLTSPSCSVTAAPNSQSDAKAYINFMNLERAESTARTVKFVLKSPSLVDPAGGTTPSANFNYVVKLGYMEDNIFKVMKQTSTANITFAINTNNFGTLTLNARSNTEIG